MPTPVECTKGSGAWDALRRARGPLLTCNQDYKCLLLLPVLTPTMKPYSSSATLHTLGFLLRPRWPISLQPRLPPPCSPGFHPHLSSPLCPLLQASCHGTAPDDSFPGNGCTLPGSPVSPGPLHPLLYSFHDFSVRVLICRHQSLARLPKQ